MRTPDEVQSLTYHCNCTTIPALACDELMRHAKKADKRKIDRLVKIHLPWLYEQLVLQYYNPYTYYKTKTHLILVHSSIEHFIQYET